MNGEECVQSLDMKTGFRFNNFGDRKHSKPCLQPSETVGHAGIQNLEMDRYSEEHKAHVSTSLPPVMRYSLDIEGDHFTVDEIISPGGFTTHQPKRKP